MFAEELPEILSVIEESGGREAALRFAEKFGGNRKYIPKTVRPDNAITLIVGQAAAEALTDLYGGERVMIPLGELSNGACKRDEIIAQLKAGVNQSEIVRNLNVHAMTVRRTKRRLERSEEEAKRRHLAALPSRVTCVRA